MIAVIGSNIKGYLIERNQLIAFTKTMNNYDVWKFQVLRPIRKEEIKLRVIGKIACVVL